MSRIINFKVLAITILSCLVVVAQTPKNFAKNGLSFDYPSEWTLTDDSTDDAQQLTLSKADSDAQIRVFVHNWEQSPNKRLMPLRSEASKPTVRTLALR